MLKNVPGVLAFFQSNDVNDKRWKEVLIKILQCNLFVKLTKK